MKQSNHIINHFQHNNILNLSNYCYVPLSLLNNLTNNINWVETVIWGENNQNNPTHKYNILNHPYLIDIIKKKNIIINNLEEFIKMISLTIPNIPNEKYYTVYEYLNTKVTKERNTLLFNLSLYHNSSIYNTPIIKKQFTNTYYSQPLYTSINFNDLSEIDIIVIILYYLNNSLFILNDNIIYFRDTIIPSIPF